MKHKGLQVQLLLIHHSTLSNLTYLLLQMGIIIKERYIESMMEQHVM